MAVWGRYLKRLRDDGDRIVMAPEPDIRDVLEYVHWIAALEPRKRQIVINKLVDYFEVAQNIFVQYNQPIRTFETTMFFIKKGICRSLLIAVFSHITLEQALSSSSFAHFDKEGHPSSLFHQIFRLLLRKCSFLLIIPLTLAFPPPY